MLHHSNFLIVFYAIFLVMMITVFIRTDATVYSNKQNTQYSSKLTAASHSAVQSLDPQKLMQGNYLWSDEKSRIKTMDTFYYTLASSFMSSTHDMTLQVSTPIIMMIDTDGYYIGYNALFNWDNLADPNKENEFDNAMQLTSLTTWGENIYGYYVRYYLTDDVSVTTDSGKAYQGKRKNVAYLMEKDGISGSIIDYLDGTMRRTEHGTDIGEEFIHRKEEFIISETEATLSRYINQYNYSAGTNAGGYQLNMPRISGEMWHRLLANPTFVTFLQGTNVNNGKEVLNTYAYSGGEIMKADKYFMTEETTPRGTFQIYHSFRECRDEGLLTDNGDGSYTFKGHSPGSIIIIDKLYFTMAECAQQGAVPCPDCIK